MKDDNARLEDVGFPKVRPESWQNAKALARQKLGRAPTIGKQRTKRETKYD